MWLVGARQILTYLLDKLFISQISNLSEDVGVQISQNLVLINDPNFYDKADYFLNIWLFMHGWYRTTFKHGRIEFNSHE